MSSSAPTERRNVSLVFPAGSLLRYIFGFSQGLREMSRQETLVRYISLYSEMKIEHC